MQAFVPLEIEWLGGRISELAQTVVSLSPASSCKQANAPAAVAGCYFDSLSFGSSPIQIVGIKNSTFRTGADQLGIGLRIQQSHQEL